jgi:hypothetical protein
MQTYIDNAIDNALGEVARASGRDLRVVWRVFGLMVAVHNCGHHLTMLDGKLTDVVPDDGERLPSSLRADIVGSWDDLVQLLPPLHRALQRLVATIGLVAVGSC